MNQHPRQNAVVTLCNKRKEKNKNMLFLFFQITKSVISTVGWSWIKWCTSWFLSQTFILPVCLGNVVLSEHSKVQCREARSTHNTYYWFVSSQLAYVRSGYAHNSVLRPHSWIPQEGEALYSAYSGSHVLEVGEEVHLLSVVLESEQSVTQRNLSSDDSDDSPTEQCHAREC